MKKEITPITDIRRIMKPYPHRDRDLRILKTDKKIPFDEDFIEDVHDEGLDLLDDKKYMQAIKEFEKIVNYEIHPDLVGDFAPWWEDALYHECEAYSELGKHEIALSIIDNLLKNNPSEVDYLDIKGYILADLQRYKESIQCYEKILKIEPKNEDAFTNISHAMLNLKKFKEALDVAEKGIELNPKDPDALYNIGESLHGLGKYKDALKAFDKVLKIDRDDSETWYMKARCLSRLNKIDEAVDALLVAIGLEPNNISRAKKEKDIDPVIKKSKIIQRKLK